MTDRERLLSGLVALLLIGALSYYAYGRYSTAVDRKTSAINALRRQLNEANLQVEMGTASAKRLNDLAERSLPANRELARSLYQRWLLNLVDRAGFAQPTVRVVDRRLRGTFYERLNFDINADATLFEVIEFLHGFYAVDDLHRIQQLNLVPDRTGRDLSIYIAVEALILPKTQRTSVGDIPSSEQVAAVDAYRDIILNRNMFFPANRRPELTVPGRVTAEVGRTFRLELEAEDPDAIDQLSFELGENAPEGMRIDQRLLELRWRPTETGQVDIELTVTDDGFPPASDTQSVQIAVVEPRAESTSADQFDDARHTYLIGIVESDGEQQAWLNLRTRGSMMKLKRGEPVNIGSVQGTIQDIRSKSIVVATDAKQIEIVVGENLLGF